MPHSAPLQIDPSTLADAGNGTANVTFFDMDAALQMHLQNTSEYKQAYNKYTAPLNMSLIVDDLLELADECSANITGAEFCNTCVRPIMRLELHAYMANMMQDDIPENLTAPAQVAVYDRCGEQILSFLGEAGVPMDDFFYGNVLHCSLHTEDPVCVAAPAVLAAALSPVLKTCDVLLSDVEHMHKMAQPDNAESAKEYCESCYWPFLRTMINHGMSDEFWCKHRGIVLRNVGNQTEERPESETALVDLLYEDDSFIACMENARSQMMQARVDVFDANLTDDIREDCWSEEFIPPVGTTLTPENKQRIRDLVCPQE